MLILKLLKKIAGYLDTDDSWDQYKMHFEEVHPYFFKNLSYAFPELTSKDLRLCAYLKIGLDYKEIGTLLNISYAGIKKALNRLKKKMNLTEEDDLRKEIAGL